MHLAVGVHEAEQLPAGLARAAIAHRADVSRLHAYHPTPHPLGDLRRVVGGTIVGDDDLDGVASVCVAISGGLHRAEQPRQERLLVERGDDEGEANGGHGVTNMRLPVILRNDDIAHPATRR